MITINRAIPSRVFKFILGGVAMQEYSISEFHYRV